MDYVLEEPRPIIQQLDQVELLTVKRVKYLSTRPGYSPSPHGKWSVVGLIDGDALLAKDDTLIRIPLGDIRKVCTHDPRQVIACLADVCYKGNRKKLITGSYNG